MIKVTDLAWARFAAPDLDRMERFLTDFGLVRSARTADALYMRGANADHHFHITHLADEPAFLGMAFKAASLGDLETLSRAEGASPVEAIDEPGGGWRVRLTDPHGFRVETVFGVGELAPLKDSQAVGPDFGPARRRGGPVARQARVPCQVRRLGHFVLNVPDCRVSDDFYKAHFGFLSSDVCYVPDNPDELAVVFNRVDRGKEFVDQHIHLSVRSQETGLGHIAFEVADVNALFIGHEHLEAEGHRHSWGIGRHTIAGQIFDYWFDPFGNRVEHYYGGDFLNADDPTNHTPLKDVLHSQWGAQLADRRASLTSDDDPLRT